METPGERPPTRLRVVCQKGWDGARRHPQPAAGVQSAEQWCSSQSQPQPQLRYQQVLMLIYISYIGIHHTVLEGRIRPPRLSVDPMGERWNKTT